MAAGATEPELRVLVVDDEPNIVDLLAAALRLQGFVVDSAGDGRGALSKVAEFRPHVLLLDVMLPDMEGFEVAERLGDRGADAPVIYLTARDSTEDKLRGLRSGDDYVTKPFSLEELIARVRVALRRSGRESGAPARLKFEDLEMDEGAREVHRSGRLIELTATEYRLLHHLMSNPRRVLTRGQLLDQVWSYDFGGDGRVLETYVSYLRRKLGEPQLIHTVRSVGYVLRAPRSDG